MKKVLVAIYRYRRPGWAADQLVQHARDSLAPVMAFFDSAVEQELITRDLLRKISVALMPDRSSALADKRRQLGFMFFDEMDVRLFYTKAALPSVPKSVSQLDQRFLSLIESSLSSFEDHLNTDVGKGVERIGKSLAAELNPDLKRAQLITALDVTLDPTRTTLLIFSGFAPISTSFYDFIEKNMKRRIKLVFLCPHQLEAIYEKNERWWRNNVVPSYAIAYPTADGDDVTNLERRVKIASDGSMLIGPESMLALTRMRRITDMKNHLISSLYRLRDQLQAHPTALIL